MNAAMNEARDLIVGIVMTPSPKPNQIGQIWVASKLVGALLFSTRLDGFWHDLLQKYRSPKKPS